jgi:hypothetical protein
VSLERTIAGALRGMIKGGIAMPSGYSKYLEARSAQLAEITFQVSPRVGGSNPPPATNEIIVRSGDMGNRTFRRHRLHFRPEGIL